MNENKTAKTPADGEPAAWLIQYKTRHDIVWGSTPGLRSNDQILGMEPLYTAPPSIEAAVLAEREACAKVCDEALLQLNETVNQLENSEYIEQCVVGGAIAQAEKLSKAIRARGEK